MTLSSSSGEIQAVPKFEPNLSKRYQFDRVFSILAWLATWFGLVVLFLLLLDVFTDGLPWLNWRFLTSFPSRRPTEAGALSAIVGTIVLMVLTALFAVPVGIASGIYLEEFSEDTWYARLIEINIGNLAAVPSIIYGLLSLQVFVRLLGPITGGRSILSGGLTLSLLVVPIIIVATRESLRSVPDSIRAAGYAVGATRWQVVREHVLPLAFPGIMTGTILALSRAIGETAPLIMIGALTFIAFLPPLSLEGLQSPFTALPIQTYNWVSRPQEDFHGLAAAAIIVLMVVLLSMNTIAVAIRSKLQKSY